MTETENRTDTRWLTIQEAAEYLGLSPDYLYRRRKAGKPPVWSHIPDSKVIRYDIEDLDAFMEQHKQDAATHEAPAA